MRAWILRRSFQPSNSVFPVWRRIDIEKRGNWNVFGKNRGIIDGGCFSRVHDGDDEWERDYSAEVFWKKKSCSPIEAPFLSIHSSCPSPALSISFHRDTKIVSSGPTELEGFLRPTKGCTSQWQRTQNGVLIQEHQWNGHTRKMH